MPDELPRSVRRVRDALVALELDADIHPLTDSTRTAPEAAAAVGCELGAIGGIPPIEHPAPVRTVLDEDLFRFTTVWAAAGHPHAVFPIEPRTLASATRAKAARLAAAG